MASIKFSDLAVSEVLDRKALQSIRGALCWVNGAFPAWVAPVAMPGAVDVFNFYQINNTWEQITNIGQQVNQVTSVGITAGAGSSNTALLLGSPAVVKAA
jgi:hypothetical protein